ncbi:hypothetical protein HK105_201986 [Polyrhizophydium stewartii]|uniref:Dienelactone hydrolase domain-containing protein n=1 Tax=Polyrhizophydium stewartii TaxID=2732419 RepID=A0ABR4NGJ4_9FUNG|nr:hypothetical protein HK105_003682 [Polyrhizophydium stewartii]
MADAATDAASAAPTATAADVASPEPAAAAAATSAEQDPPAFCKHCIEGYIWQGVTTGTEVTVAGLPTYFAAAPQPTNKAVVVVHDALSFDLPNTRMICDVIAKDGGFNVYMPDLFKGDRMGPPEKFDGLMNKEPTLTGKLTQAVRIVAAIPASLSFFSRHGPKETMPLLDAVIADLRASHGVEHLGAVGYCWGGRFSAMLGAQGKVSAFVAAHPSNLALPADLAGVGDNCKAALFIVAENDMVLPLRSVERIRGILAAQKAVHEVKLFKDMIHGFAVRGLDLDDKVRKARDEALVDTVKWLRAHV